MATENPIRMSGTNERWSNSRQVSVPNRSGSAPPSMEGSFLAVDNLLSRQGGSGYNNLKLPSYGFEEPVTTHPSYSSKHSLNRIPSPPIYYPTDYHQFIDNRVGRFRSNMGLNKVNFPNHLSQGTLSSHKEVSEDESSQQLSVNSVSDRTNGLDICLSPGSQGLDDFRQDDSSSGPTPQHSRSNSSNGEINTADEGGNFSEITDDVMVKDNAASMTKPNMGIMVQYLPTQLGPPLSPGPVPYVEAYPGWQPQGSLEGANGPRLCNFLEELKSGKGRRFDLSDITGHIVEFSADQHGSRFIQQKLENCNPEEKAAVFREVLPHACKLMTDVFGNYVIQKFFEYGNSAQRKELADQLMGQIVPLSLQMYGCRVIQKALDVIEPDQRVRLARELDGQVMRCVRDQNGNHVIQKCIENIPADRVGFMLYAFRGQVSSLSMHPYGCRVIQRLLERCSHEHQCRFITEEILESVCVLSKDQYGNYVTQHVLEKGTSIERERIVRKLSGHIVQLSLHKFASNVIEKCLEYGGRIERDLIIKEIAGPDESYDSLLMMMKDQYGNYVVQKIFQTCTADQRATLFSRVRMHASALKKYTYGKHIVTRLEQPFGEENQELR